MNSEPGVQYSQSLQIIRLTGNVLVNLLLIPVYAVFLFLCLCVALTPLFPARTARENLKKRLEVAMPKSIFATTAILFHYVLVVIEDFVFFPLGLIATREDLNSQSEVHASATSASQRGVGLAILSAHFGNIEVSAHCVQNLLLQTGSFNQKLMALAKPSRWTFATKTLEWFRAKRNIEVIWTNRKDLVKAMMTALKNRRALALLIDQKPATGGHFVDFFGAPSAFPEGGIEVALRVNAEFVFFTSRRLWPGHYTYEAKHFTRRTDALPTVTDVLTAYVCWLELVIRKSPWQWCWDYRKWSRQPKSEPHA